jgi:natural resistance-associated macrophage protein 2
MSTPSDEIAVLANDSVPTVPSGQDGEVVEEMKVKSVSNLDTTTNEVSRDDLSGAYPSRRRRWAEVTRKFFKYTGPGWLMSLAYLDPGNLEADLQAGAYTNYQLLWVLLVAHVIGFFMQILAARLGTVSGRHLAEICRERYPRPVAVVLWAMTELAIIGADVQEVVGTAIALNVLFGLPMWAGVLITVADTITFLGVHYLKGVRPIEFIIFSLLLVMMICFFINFGTIAPPVGDVFGGFLPTNLHQYAVLQAVAIIGAVIMPHNIYLHSALVTEKKVDVTDRKMVKEANLYFAIDSGIALTISFVVNLALLSSFASGFFASNCAGRNSPEDIHFAGGASFLNLGCLVGLTSPDDSVCPDAVSCACVASNGMGGFCSKIGLEEASSALENLLGSHAKYIFALGLFAAGQASTLTGTFAGQYVMNGFMRFNIPIWVRTLITRLVALGPALVIAICQAQIPSLSEANEWINVLQAIQLPFAVLPLLHFVKDPTIMGSEFVLKSVWKLTILWTISVCIIVTNFYLVLSHIIPMHPVWWVWVLASAIGIGYLFLCYKCMESDVRALIRMVFGRKEQQTVSYAHQEPPTTSYTGLN